MEQLLGKIAVAAAGAIIYWLCSLEKNSLIIFEHHWECNLITSHEKPFG